MTATGGGKPRLVMETGVAIYHFSGQILGRAGKVTNGEYRPGSKAVAAAAYRAGERLEDQRHHESHDYSRRKGVVHSEILAPNGSAPWLRDRQTLWNTVEAMETRKDAQLAREFNMALPYELTHDDRLELVRDFVDRHFVQKGMVADIALHDPVPDQGQSRRNFHAHVMLTLRRATPGGLDPVKTREWNSKELLNIWRAEWAVSCNAALERAGKKVRVDHRTLIAQRDWARSIGDRVAADELNRQPEIHVGPKARKLARRQIEPRSRVREVGPFRKREGRPSSDRRQRNYPAYDRGSRLSWLQNILAGNNEKLKRDMVANNRRYDRISRKLDYWERRMAFKSEGLIKGKRFRFERWKAAQPEKVRRAEVERKAAHARHRLGQLKGLLKQLELLIAVTTRRRETVLVRAREVEEWYRSLHQTVHRLHGREPRGRGRKREKIF